LILGLFVVRPILSGKSNVPALPSYPDGEIAGVIEGDVTGSAEEQAQIAGPTEASPDAVARLREMISERETETVQLLQDWMEEPDAKEAT